MEGGRAETSQRRGRVAGRAPPKPATPDFRSVLGSKKKLPTENGSNNTEALNAKAAEGLKPVGNAQPSGFLKPVGNAKLADTEVMEFQLSYSKS